MKQFQVKNLMISVVDEKIAHAGYCLYPSACCGKFHSLLGGNSYGCGFLSGCAPKSIGCGGISVDCGISIDCIQGTQPGGGGCGLNFSTCFQSMLMTTTEIRDRGDLAVFKGGVEAVMKQLEEQIRVRESGLVPQGAEVEQLAKELEGALSELKSMRKG